MPYLLCSREMLGVRAGVDLRRMVALENRTRPLLRKLLENLVSPVRVCQPVNNCFAVVSRREHLITTTTTSTTMQACGWRLHEIFLVGVGFGEGSVAAVDLMLHLG